LEALAAETLDYPMVYRSAADVIADQGEPEIALTYYDLAYATLIGRDVDVDDEEFADDVEQILTGRLSVRAELNLPPDELDQAAVALLEGDGEYFDAPSQGEVRVPVWPRDELPHAVAAFPWAFGKADADVLIRDYEAFCRVVAESGAPRITLVPLTVTALAEFATRTGGTPGDERIYSACAEELADQGVGIAWPPPRNEPCWCRSAIKYKKCCGRPDLTE